jgi:hypothetical protein
MASKCKSLIKTVIHEKPKMLIGFSQKGTRTGLGSINYPDEDVVPPVNRRRLTLKLSFKRNVVSPYHRLEIGKPVARQAVGGAGRGMWRKQRPLCNEADRD